jgi:hypothetical protein
MALFTETHAVAIAISARVHSSRHAGSGTTTLRKAITNSSVAQKAVLRPMISAVRTPRSAWGRNDNTRGI